MNLNQKYVIYVKVITVIQNDQQLCYRYSNYFKYRHYILYGVLASDLMNCSSMRESCTETAPAKVLKGKNRLRRMFTLKFRGRYIF